MHWLLILAVKSFIVAGGALLLLRLLKTRSASDRSWIAHLALAGLLLLPIAAVALPTLDVTGPEMLVGTEQAAQPGQSVRTADPATEADSTSVATDPGAGSAPVNWPFWGYAAPASVLLLLTLIALARLFVLKARARVLIDAPWLTALARAQSRMGFKHGTALLTSNELPSPISWGVVRPVILLNQEASQSHDEAEAIITHELAHVAHLDWAKLLIARIATALFWFNPFVWLLAREAHQLREEAADDAVLATDIDETDYARLLVGVARHECRGFLIGAHGVAPGRNSLSRRVKRVLDGAVKRAPGGWRWGSAAAFFAAGMAVPVAALNLVPAASASESARDSEIAQNAGPYYKADEGQASLVIGPDSLSVPGVISADDHGIKLHNGDSTITASANGATVMTSSDGSTITIAAPDAQGRRRTVLKSSDGSTIALADARGVPGLAAAIASANPPIPPRTPPVVRRGEGARDINLTPDYLRAMRSAAGGLDLSIDDIAGLKAIGVTPGFLQAVTRSGYRGVDADSIGEAYAVGVREPYLREIAAAGYGRVSLEDLTELRAIGITGRDIAQYRKAGFKSLDVERLTELKALGMGTAGSRDPDP